MLKVSPIQGEFGARIEGLDASKPIEPSVMKEVIDAFHEHQFIVVPGQTLTKPQYLAWANNFGHPHPHVVRQARGKEFPAILTITNKMKESSFGAGSTDTDEFKEGKEPYQGAAHWHTDQSYEADPVSSTMLYSIEAPEVGGETRFADMFRAYDDLSDEMKSRIAELRATHLYGEGVAHRDDDIPPTPLETQEEKEDVPLCSHLLARPHPVTGRIALYSPGGTSRGIVGMEDGAARELLNELAAHAVQPKYVYKHKWSVGEITVFDTSSTLHAASAIPPATGPKDTRFLYRISIKGKPGVCA